VFASINHALVMAAREKAGREASPAAGVIDSLPDASSTLLLRTAKAKHIHPHSPFEELNPNAEHC
jgi:hypothetical protein